MNQVELMVNGESVKISIPSNERLLDTLRERLGLKSVKEGCGSGECGACTIILDGNPVCSCLMRTVQADGKSITTLEGIGKDGGLHPVQKAFMDAGAIQCGFCTPGMILTTVALLKKNPTPSDEEIKEALSGNICRCTGYVKIIEAVKMAAKHMEGKVDG